LNGAEGAHELPGLAWHVVMQIIQVDAFTAVPFRGNPAAVLVLEQERTEAWMQDVAREMNLAETAFVREGRGAWGLRWFTPVREVELCGHATLASAHVLWETGRLEESAEARFDTLSGRLSARQVGEWIEMDFPLERPVPVDPPAGLIEALGVRAQAVGRNRMDYLVEVADEAEVRAADPDIARLRAVEARGVIVTARASGDRDFVSRFFAPRVGVDEDPVTGSAHCALAPYWAHRLGRSEMVGYQASARGGYVRVRVDGDRVLLGGQAVTVMRGELLETKVEAA
jgi:PhzF family phenazine biosynthesis protein